MLLAGTYGGQRGNERQPFRVALFNSDNSRLSEAGVCAG